MASIVILYYLHYILIASGISSAFSLLGVTIHEYTDASQGEIGLLLMSLPFVITVARPYFCYLADKHAAHRRYFIASLICIVITYLPMFAIPFFPSFYPNHGRVSWWIMVLVSIVGTATIEVALSLGDTLAVNAADRTNSAFGRMRTCGTLSWGIFGYMIGQFNETSALPKYTPGFIILMLSMLLNAILFTFWTKDAFVLGDKNKLPADGQLRSAECYDSAFSSLEGTLRMDKNSTKSEFKAIQIRQDLNNKLNNLAQLNKDQIQVDEAVDAKSSSLTELDLACTQQSENQPVEKQAEKQKANLQITLLKMILKEDKRLIKYLTLYAVLGFITSPIGFLFLSIEEASKGSSYNFSELAGCVIMSQAFVESFFFFILPYANKLMSRIHRVMLILILLSIRSVYYSTFYYTSGASLYWAALAECAQGVTFAVYTTLNAELSLMFSNLTTSFIPRLRQLGVIGDPSAIGDEQARKEEASVDTALRASLQSSFGTALEGLGYGLGCLACGLVYDSYGHINMWRMMAVVTLLAFALHLLVELSQSKYSDLYRARRRSLVIPVTIVTCYDKPELEQDCH